MNEKLSMSALKRISLEEFHNANKIPLTVVLDDLRSMNNVGSVFRTCDAFRIEKLVLCGITPTPPHRDINKTALGATQSVDWTFEKDIEKVLLEYKKSGYKIYALEQTTQSIMLNDLEIDPSQKSVLILGNEVEGVSDKTLLLCDSAIEIPQAGTKHSLNVSVACGIALYGFFNRLVAHLQ